MGDPSACSDKIRLIDSDINIHLLLTVSGGKVLPIRSLQKFTLRGKEAYLSKKDIEKVAKKRIPGRGKTYYALIDGKRIPVKNLLYEVFKEKGYDVTLLDFTTQDALRILRKLDVEIVEERDIGTAKSLLTLAGALALGGDAVEDEQRLYK
jgi:hypothetical protein